MKAKTEIVRKYYKYGSTINGTISGTLTNNNGVLSGFSTSNYVTLPNTLDVSNGKTWEFSTKVVVGSQQSQQSTVLGHGTIGCGGIWIEWNRQSNKKFGVAIGSGTSSSSSWDIASHVQGTTVFNTGTTVWLRCVFDGSSYKLFSKLNKEDNWIQELSVSSSVSMSTYTKFIGMAQSGGSTNGFAWVGGSIDMKETYINIDGAQWWRGVAAEESTSSDYDYYKDVPIYKLVNDNNVYKAIKSYTKGQYYGN